jgi:leader peptidase (prepilin peptidase)/N-methyltransferase
MLSVELVEFAPSARRWLSLVIVLALTGLNAALVWAVISGECQAITEGGSIDWVQWRLLYQAALIAALVAATVLDLVCYVIPDAITLPATLLAVACATALGNMQLVPLWVDWNNVDPIRGPYIPDWIRHHPHWHGLAHSAAGMLAGAGVTWSARAIARAILRVEALGLGDVTLMAMVGAYLGWQPVIVVFLLGPLCGIVVAAALALTGGRRAMPYGPCLALAALVVLFAWKQLWLPTREIFGHWPTLVGLAALVIGGMALLLGLLRFYRSIPVALRRK